ncbi:MAG: acyl-CoA dehydrogenase family protein, partial [Phenylobacterium sp.]
GCQLFSARGGGADRGGLRTTAARAHDGSGDWIVNGSKVWTSGAQHSQWGLLITRTDPNVAKHKGLTMFFLRMDTPGVEIRPIKQANGQSGFNEVFFNDVRIPDSQRLGAVGQGWEVSLTTLMNERLSIGSGMSTGFPELFRFCLEAEIDGAPAVDDSAVRSRLAQFAVKQSGLKYTGMRAITALSKGQTPGPENSIGKLVAGATMQELAMFALDLQGQAGVVQDADSPMNARFQAILMRSPATRVEGGTDEVLRNIIAERVLGLPGDIRVDKNVALKDIPTSGRAK